MISNFQKNLHAQLIFFLSQLHDSLRRVASASASALEMHAAASDHRQSKQRHFYICAVFSLDAMNYLVLINIGAASAEISESR